MTRRRKIKFAAITLAVMLIGCEVAARGYSAIRFGNARAFRYGGDLIRHWFEGAQVVDEGWGAGRSGPPADDAAAINGEVADQRFQNRHDPNDGLSTRPAGVMTMNGGIPASINTLGYRGKEISRQAPPGIIRIAAFGGSYVFGAYLRDDETWPFRLEQKLNAGGDRAEVINAGISGATVHNVLEDVIRLTNWARIDIAVVTTAYNNHALLPIQREYTVMRRADYYLYNASLFYVMFKEKFARMISQPLDYGLYRQRVAVRLQDVEWLVNLYARRLDQIATVCDERGIRLVLATQPEVFFQADLNRVSSQDRDAIGRMTDRLRQSGTLSIAELEYYLQGRLNLALRDVAAARRVPVFDGEAALFDSKGRYFSDQIHPNTIGAEKLAADLQSFLEKHVLTSGRND